MLRFFDICKRWPAPAPAKVITVFTPPNPRVSSRGLSKSILDTGSIASETVFLVSLFVSVRVGLRICAWRGMDNSCAGD
jgi:hypothetical protein